MLKRFFFFITIFFLFLEKGNTQDSHPKWSIGLDAMGNILQGDLSNHPLFFSGDIFGKWNAAPWFSLSAAFSIGQLRSSLDANESTKSSLTGYPEKIQTDYSSFGLYAGIPFYTEWIIPQIFLGAEFLHFDPENGSDAKPLPAINFNKNVLGFLIGVGFELPVNQRFSINVKTFLHLSGSDYLDYYVAGSNPDAFTTFGAGLSYNFGSPDAIPSSIPFTDSLLKRRAWNGQIDSDGDGIGDEDEISKYHTDPYKADTDDDGLTDFQEVYNYRTDPNKQDTDSDGLYDGDEVLKYHTDPLSWDSDGDGLADGYEANISHTNPTNRDTDGDGIPDKEDKCPLEKGVAPDGCPSK
jgi:hypothetical protein